MHPLNCLPTVISARPTARLTAIALFIWLGIGAAAVWGSDLSEEEISRRVQAVAGALRCPTCQALSVWDSNAPFALQIRAKVERMVREGQSDEQIKTYFISRYGEWVLRTPPWRGVGWLVWLLPILALGLGGAWLLMHMRESDVADGQTSSPAVKLTPAQRRRVQEDLRRWEQL